MKRLNQRGAVAILTVVIFSLIVTIVVTAYARITVVEHQESISYDLSTRAYYAAETGVQDAVRDIRKSDPADPNSLRNKGRPDNCKPTSPPVEFGWLGESSNLSYTCQIIDVTPNGVVSSTNTEKSNLFELVPNETLDVADSLGLQVLWSEGGDSVDPIIYPRENDSKLFPQTSSWKNSVYGVHPLLRVTIIRVKNGGNTDPDLKRDSFTQHTYFLNPTTTASSPPTIDFQPQKSNEVIQNASCVKSSEIALLNDGYSCAWEGIMRAKDFDDVDIPPDNQQKSRIFVSFSSEYGNTNYKFSLLKGSDDLIELKEAQAVIDVTARAGNVFRRVQQRVPLDNNYSQVYFGADALVVGKGICKHFKITDKPDDFSGCVTAP